MASTTSTAPTSTPTTRVAEQGGVLEGANPSHYDPSNPIILFIIQVSMIIIVCHILHWPLSKIRQPRVIAEVLGGIILGPSVMGRIPGFRDAIFPTASLPNLNVVANLGLVLYLFLIGLETDVRFLLRNWKVATSVAFAGFALPFGIGCGLAWGVYTSFRNDADIHPIAFSVYMLFIGIAVAITAFPVLCRILTELKLLDTSVGIITLSAGVANDVVGWLLLALCVALVNAGTGLTALWILFCCLGFMLLLLAVKPSLAWLLRRTGNIDHDPSQSAISLILLIALASAFYAGIIGVHPIFGAFMAGLIIPRDNRFNIRVTEKLEDLIGAILLPLYFTLSGLNTNLGLLDTGLAWGYVFATTIVAMTTKIIGASLAARLNGLVWRESFTISVLMSCKGLVELIVLNIGLQAKILSTRTFTIFVVMALLTTFATTPIVTVLYPPWYQKKIEAWKRGEIDWDTGAPTSASDADEASKKKSMERVGRILVYLSLNNMAPSLSLLSLLGNPSSEIEPQPSPSADEKVSENQLFAEGPKRAVWAHGMRLLQLTDRDSSVMTVSQVSEYSRRDPIVNTFRTVGQLHNLAASGEVAIMPETLFVEALVAKSLRMSSDLLLVPWSEGGNAGDAQALTAAADDSIFSSYGSFVKDVFKARDRNIAVFYTRSVHDTAEKAKTKASDQAQMARAYTLGVLKEDMPAAPRANKPYHIFLPYLGGAHEDDRLALRLVLQLCEKSRATATIMRIVVSTTTVTSMGGSVSSTVAGSDMEEDPFTVASTKLPAEVANRVRFETAAGAATTEELLRLAIKETHPDAAADARAPVLVVLGRGSGDAMDVGKLESRPREELRSCLGSLAGHLVAGGVRADLLVVQAKKRVDGMVLK